LKKLFKGDNEIRIIGTRHGEKLYETLLTREEMARAEDMGDYYRIPADIRDLNYACYFTEGETEVSCQEDYNSHNTQRLNEDEVIELLLKLDFVRVSLEARKIVKQQEFGYEQCIMSGETKGV
jgi:UDP-N-acetylglucosamine 4,6-dehydratase/5-epimerase